MGEEVEIEKFYKVRAEEIVDTLYDKGYFREDVARSDMRSIESLIGYYLQSTGESAVKCSELVKRTKAVNP